MWDEFHPYLTAVMTLELSEDEKLALVVLLKSVINDDRYPLSPRIRALKGILAKLEPPAAVAAPKPSPNSQPGDGPSAAVRARKRRRNG